MSGAGSSTTGARPPLVPGFVLGFLALAIFNSVGLIPGWLSDLAGAASRWALLIAMAAVGIKTSIGKIVEVGGRAIALIVAETVFIGAFIVGGLHFFH